MAVCFEAIGWNCPGGKCPGRIFFLGGNCPGGSYPRGAVLGGSCLEGNCPEGIVWGEIYLEPRGISDSRQ